MRLKWQRADWSRTLVKVHSIITTQGVHASQLALLSSPVRFEVGTPQLQPQPQPPARYCLISSSFAT